MSVPPVDAAARQAANRTLEWNGVLVPPPPAG
ncbi:hypothetical protein ACRB68_25070 [Actinomadura sp. RB68]|uniref:Uncharacterized protein n=1 Tax=Actinomadura macrotermitis TaxID=2585200 RepID=A0A7K0BTD5_9ACTN|nr:hypothetical protein [Actinomadura macrotermitis]